MKDIRLQGKSTNNSSIKHIGMHLYRVATEFKKCNSLTNCGNPRTFENVRNAQRDVIQNSFHAKYVDREIKPILEHK